MIVGFSGDISTLRGFTVVVDIDVVEVVEVVVEVESNAVTLTLLESFEWPAESLA